jgi:hypothetical protein
MQAPMSPTHSNHPSQVHLVFQASHDRGGPQQAVPVQQSHISPIPIELERRMLQQPMHAQQSPFPPMLMPMQQAPGIHAMREAPIYSYNSPAFHMPTILQQAGPMQQWCMSHMPAQQAETEHAYLDNAKKKMQQFSDPSNDQIQTFQQRAWNSKKMQIDLHEWLGEMRKKGLIEKVQEEALCHRIHKRDHDIIQQIIIIRDYAETMDKAHCLTWTDSESPATGTKEIPAKEIAAEYKLLADALQEREREIRLFPQALLFPFGYVRFSPEEWSNFQVTEVTKLKKNSYIRIATLNSNRYFYNFKQADMEFVKQMLKYASSNTCSNALQTAPTFQVQLPDGKPFLSARLRFKRTCRKKSAHILQVPCKKEEDICNVPLVRYFVENVWKLERPDVIISVTGGADNFDLPPEHIAMLMRGMMEGTRKLKTWSVSIYGCILFCPFVVIASCMRACVL